jgi:iron complex transport system substrate-binding protein
MVLNAWPALCAAREIEDMSGRSVAVPDQINGVFGTSPIATYLIYSLDPALVAGLNSQPTADEKAYLRKDYLTKPFLGGWLGQGKVANLEVLLQAGPDVVVNCTWGKSAMSAKIEKALEPLGLPVVHIEIRDLDDYPAAYRFLGSLFHLEERGEQLASYAERLIAETAAIRSSLAADAQPRIYYAEGAQGLQSECRGSVHSQLIPLAGGINVHQCRDYSEKGMVAVSMEQLLAYQPAVIITHDDVFFRSLERNSQWQHLNAVTSGQVYRIPTIPFNWFDRPPSCLRLLGLKWLQHVLFNQPGEAELIAETQQFFSLFLDVSLSQQQAEEVLGL